MFKNFIIIALSIYSIFVTYIAYPIIKEAYVPETVTVDAGESDEQWEFLKDTAKLILYADAQGYKLTAGEFYRTPYQQRYYVLHGLSKTSNSLHLKRRAADFNFFKDRKHYCPDMTTDPECMYGIKDLGYFWEELNENNKWGGNWYSFKDYDHFQRGKF